MSEKKYMVGILTEAHTDTFCKRMNFNANPILGRLIHKFLLNILKIVGEEGYINNAFDCLIGAYHEQGGAIYYIVDEKTYEFFYQFKTDLPKAVKEFAAANYQLGNNFLLAQLTNDIISESQK